jgi:hypothetical protein
MCQPSLIQPLEFRCLPGLIQMFTRVDSDVYQGWFRCLPGLIQMFTRVDSDVYQGWFRCLPELIQMFTRVDSDVYQGWLRCCQRLIQRLTEGLTQMLDSNALKCNWISQPMCQTSLAHWSDVDSDVYQGWLRCCQKLIRMLTEGLIQMFTRVDWGVARG